MQRRSPLTKVLLAVLAEVSSAAIELDTKMLELGPYLSAYARGGSEYVAELRQLRRVADARAALRALRRANYLTARRIGARLQIALTEKGRVAMLVAGLRSAPPHPNGLATVVIFDIPESERAARRSFRLLLRDGGYTRLQQSVWVSWVDNYDTMARFIRQAKLDRWVNLYRARDFLVPPRRFTSSRSR